MVPIYYVRISRLRDELNFQIDATEDTGIGIPICDEILDEKLGNAYSRIVPLEQLLKWLLLVKAIDVVLLCCGIVAGVLPDNCDRDFYCRCKPEE